MKLTVSVNLLLAAILPSLGQSSTLPREGIRSSRGGDDFDRASLRGSPMRNVDDLEQAMDHNPAASNESFSGYVGPGVYYIKNLQTGSYLDLWSDDSRPNAKIAGWPFNAKDNQRWQVVEVGDGTLLLINNGTGTIAGATAPGGPVNNQIQPPHVLKLRWDVNRDFGLEFDGYPVRLMNEETCEALGLPPGQPYGTAYTSPADKEYPHHGWYFDWIYDNRTSCSKHKKTNNLFEQELK